MIIKNKYDNIINIFHGRGYRNVLKDAKTYIKLYLFGTTFLISTFLSVWIQSFVKDPNVIAVAQTITVLLAIYITLIPFIKIIKIEVLSYDYNHLFPIEINILTDKKITIFEEF